MRHVTDPTGTTWNVEELGRHTGAFSHSPGSRLPEPKLALLRCTSDQDQFVVEVGVGWRDLTDDQLWERLARARQRQ